MSKSKVSKVNLEADVAKIVAKMTAVANGATKVAAVALHAQAENAMITVRKFAPHKLGALDSKRAWTLRKNYQRKGSGEVSYTIELNGDMLARKYGKGKKVRLKDYAELMENGINGKSYKLGKGSQEKHDQLDIPGYVGMHYFYRGMLKYHGLAGAAVARAVKGYLKNKAKRGKQ